MTTFQRSTVDDVGRQEAPADRLRRRPAFYAVMCGLLLALVLLGFSRSWYAAPLFGAPAVSGPLHLHGTMLTFWFLFLLVQALLVRSRNVGLHRRLGIAGAVVAVGVVASSAWILALRDAPYVEEAPGRGFGNLLSLVAFALCIGVGIGLRRRPPVHRRLVLAGSIIIVAPALSRIFYSPPGTSGPATVVALLLVLSSLLVHDLVVRRRPHLASVGALALVFVVAPAITFALVETGVWPAFVRSVA